jgi:hypothetical protein
MAGKSGMPAVYSAIRLFFLKFANDMRFEMPGCFRKAVGAGLALAFFAQAAAAETPANLRIGHYSLGTGLAGFVLDRLETPVKFRMDGSEEILALTPEPAARDNITLKRDDGKGVMRVSDYGEVLLFTQDKAGSARAFRDKDAQPLAIKKATKAQALAGATALSQKLKSGSGVTVAVALEAPRLADGAAGWSAMADAVTVAGIALAEVAASPIGREAIAAKVKRVVIRDAANTDIKFAEGTLVVAIAADKPIVGRPSSARLVSAIGDLL